MLLLLLLCASVRGAEYHIKNVNEFRNFLSELDYCHGFLGTTVFLETDIDLSGNTLFSPGSTGCNFKGVFDGRGYMIRNAVIEGGANTGAGIFGHTEGQTTKNLVIDSSCTVKATTNSNFGIAAGAIIGVCRPKDRDCNIENCVNMANIVYETNSSSRVTIGGIIGRVYSSSYSAVISNCVNYGSVSYEGSSNGAYVGGILGGYDGSQSTNTISIKNCLNYSKITGKTTSTSLYFGIGGLLDILRRVNL